MAKTIDDWDEHTYTFHDSNSNSLFKGFHREFILIPEVQKRRQEKERYFLKYEHEKDDRVTVLIAALIIEKELDGLLSAWIPDYKKISDLKDFTFSLKVQLALSLKMIPPHILNCIEPIRQIRNLFAHDLEISSFVEAKATEKGKKYLQDLHNKTKAITVKWTSTDDRKTLFHLASGISWALYEYALQLEDLNKRLRSKDFIKNIYVKR